MGTTLCGTQNKDDSINTPSNISDTLKKLDDALYDYCCNVDVQYKTSRNLYFNRNNIGKIEIICFENDITEDKLQYNLYDIAVIIEKYDKTFPLTHVDIYEEKQDMLNDNDKVNDILKVLQNCYSNKYFYSNKNDLSNNDNNYDLCDYNYNKCSSIYECMHSREIIIALKRYSKITNTKNESEANKKLHEFIEHYIIDETNNKKHNLITNYHHILNEHLNNVIKTENIQNFEYIHDEITKDMHQCNLKYCNGLTRNNRNREQNDFKDKDDEYCSRFYIDLLDSMHVYFAHSFETGFRMKIKDQPNHMLDDMSDESKEDEEAINFVDSQLKYIQNWLHNKKQELIKIRGNDINESQHNKFVTKTEKPEEMPFVDLLTDHLNKNKTKKELINQWLDYIRDNEYDTDCIVDDFEDSMQSNISNKFGLQYYESIQQLIKCMDKNAAIEYGFGVRFYYWPHFKNHKFYVVPKFKNLKEEILAMGYGIDTYKINNEKANKYLLESVIIKRMKSNYDYDTDNIVYGDENYYEIDLFSPVSLSHVIAMLCYTNETELCTEFSKSFRKYSKLETDESLKYRNCEWGNMSKKIRELIECYGEKIYLAKDPIFFHGVSFLHFNKFVTSFCGPTSTTKQIEVAIRFASTDGMLLKLQQSSYDDRNLKYFNCSLISTYSNEDERIFCGGSHEIKFKSIILIRGAQDFSIFIKALTDFNKIINGQPADPSKKSLYIIDILFNINNDYMFHSKSSLPSYIEKCVELFCLEKKVIKFNMERVHWNYPSILQHITSNEKILNLLNYDLIIRLFKSVHTIVCTNSDRGPHSYSPSIINESYITKLMSQINNLNVIKSLKQVVVTTKYPLSEQLHLTKYDLTHWKIEKITETEFHVKFKE